MQATLEKVEFNRRRFDHWLYRKFGRETRHTDRNIRRLRGGRVVRFGSDGTALQLYDSHEQYWMEQNTGHKRRHMTWKDEE